MADTVATEGAVAQEVQASVAAPEPTAAPTPEKAETPTIAPELTAAPAPAKAEPPAPPVAQAPVVEKKVAEPTYACKNKKHGTGTAYIVVEGTAFCNLCVRDLFQRHFLKPMKQNKTP